MMPEEYLTKKDFQHFESRLWERFDRNDNLSRGTGERLAVVEAQGNRLEGRLDNHKSDTRKTASGWGAGIGAAAAAFVYGLFSLLTGGHK